MIISDISEGFDVIIGVDTSKNSFYCCTITKVKGDQGKIKKLSRSKFERMAAETGSKTLIFMEACSGSNHWYRAFTAAGATVKLIAPQHVKKYLPNRRVKNDANDARAILECGLSAATHFVKPKTQDQQDLAILHTLRRTTISDRVGLSNRIRGLLTEYNVICARGRAAFENELPELMEKCESLCNQTVVKHLKSLFAEYYRLRDKEKELDEDIRRLAHKDPLVDIAMSCHGVGEVTASALVAEIGDASAFTRGKELAANYGLVPSQHSTGGRERTGSITKTGSVYIRSLMVQCANSIALYAKKRLDEGKDDQFDRYILRLMSRMSRAKAIVALANKLLRTLWAMLRSRKKFEPKSADPEKESPISDAACLL